MNYQITGTKDIKIEGEVRRQGSNRVVGEYNWVMGKYDQRLYIRMKFQN